MRKVKIPTSMNPFVVHVNGEKYVYPAGTEQEVTDAVANVIDAYIKKENQQPDPTESPFSTSWNDLKDKPFGETTVKGDTLTWDGNTEGLVNQLDRWYKVSDSIVSMDYLANGCTFVIGGDTENIPVDLIMELVSGIITAHGFVWFVAEQGVGVDLGEGIIFTESGVYFTAEDADYVSSLTIPGYNGFETTTIKPLAEQYMPILTSPSGKKFKLSVDDSGVLSATEV